MSLKDKQVFPSGGTPKEAPNGLFYRDRLPGMTLREHYAGLAMAAMIPTIRTEKDAKRFIASSVEAADALIAELEKTNETL